MRKRRWRQEKGEQANQQVKQITRAVDFGHAWIKSHVGSVSLASAALRTRRAHGANNKPNKLKTRGTLCTSIMFSRLQARKSDSKHVIPNVFTLTRLTRVALPAKAK